MIDAAMRRELAAMLRERAEQAMEAQERQYLILAEDCEAQLANAQAMAKADPYLAQ
jgi:hypothetical protein